MEKYYTDSRGVRHTSVDEDAVVLIAVPVSVFVLCIVISLVRYRYVVGTVAAEDEEAPEEKIYDAALAEIEDACKAVIPACAATWIACALVMAVVWASLWCVGMYAVCPWIMYFVWKAETAMRAVNRRSLASSASGREELREMCGVFVCWLGLFYFITVMHTLMAGFYLYLSFSTGLLDCSLPPCNSSSSTITFTYIATTLAALFILCGCLRKLVQCFEGIQALLLLLPFCHTDRARRAQSATTVTEETATRERVQRIIQASREHSQPAAAVKDRLQERRRQMLARYGESAFMDPQQQQEHNCVMMQMHRQQEVLIQQLRAQQEEIAAMRRQQLDTGSYPVAELVTEEEAGTLDFSLAEVVEGRPM